MAKTAIASVIRNGQLGTLYSDGSFVAKQTFSPVPNYTSAITKQPAYAPPPGTDPHINPSTGAWDDNYYASTHQNSNQAPNTSTPSGPVYTPPPPLSIPKPYTPPVSMSSFSNLLQPIVDKIGRDLTGKIGSGISTLGNIPLGGTGVTSNQIARKYIPNFTVASTLQNYGGNKFGSLLSAIVKPTSAYASDGTNTSSGGASRGAVTDTSNLFSSKPLPKSDLASYGPSNPLDSGKIIGDQNAIKGNVNQLIADNNASSSTTGGDPYQTILKNYDEQMAAAGQDGAAQAAIQKKATEDIYNSLMADQAALIPDYTRQTDAGITQLNNYLGDAKTEGTLQKTNIGNTYGDLIRRSTANTNSSTVNLKNLFSSLGTAESSAFINKAGDIARAGDQSINDLGKTSVEKQAAIDTSLTNLSRDTQLKVENLIADRNSKIEAVHRQVNATDAEKASKLDSINQSLSDAIAAIKNDVSGKKADILLAQQAVQDARNSIYDQGNIDSSLLDKQFNLQAQLLGPQTSGYSDADLNQLAQPYSSMAKESIANGLKSKYPSLADLIDGVKNGTRSLDELKKALGTAGLV